VHLLLKLPRVYNAGGISGQKTLKTIIGRWEFHY